jgi:hypothetical protein
MFWFAKRLLLLGFVISGWKVLGTDFDEHGTSYVILLLDFHGQSFIYCRMLAKETLPPS